MQNLTNTIERNPSKTLIIWSQISAAREVIQWVNNHHSGDLQFDLLPAHGFDSSEVFSSNVAYSQILFATSGSETISQKTLEYLDELEQRWQVEVNIVRLGWNSEDDELLAAPVGLKQFNSKKWKY